MPMSSKASAGRAVKVPTTKQNPGSWSQGCAWVTTHLEFLPEPEPESVALKLLVLAEVLLGTTL